LASPLPIAWSNCTAASSLWIANSAKDLVSISLFPLLWRFKMRFPIRQTPAGTRVRLPRVLVIEDDRAAAQLIQTQLISAGYEALVCPEPQNALELAVQFQPGAITLDIVMKPKNGWEVLSQLKRDPRTAHIP